MTRDPGMLTTRGLFWAGHARQGLAQFLEHDCVLVGLSYLPQRLGAVARASTEEMGPGQ